MEEIHVINVLGIYLYYSWCVAWSSVVVVVVAGKNEVRQGTCVIEVG